MAELPPLHAAVTEVVHDGDEVALEGFTHLIPVAAGQEIIRQRRRDLTLVRMTPDIVYDQMIGAGTGEEFTAVPALNPDVGIVHAQRADRSGSVQMWGITGVQNEVVLASARSIVTVEEIVDEMMTVAAARALRDGGVCFVGIGLPSTAANLAKRTHARDLVLIYESGTLGSNPARLPPSIGDGCSRRPLRRS